MDKPFEIKIRKKSDLQTVKFSGNLMINYIEEIAKTVKEKVDLSKAVHVDIASPENIDLTFIQLVLSLQKTCLSNSVEFTVSSKIKDDLKLLLANAGFNNIISN